jgi:D-amino peptidase
MKKLMRLAFGLLLFLPLAAQEAKGPRVFISVDMEGVAGVVVSEECSRTASDDYQYFRRLMSLEASAAAKGAFDAGASEVWVRDSHGSARNILPDLLDRRALLLRDWSGGPMVMMEGIDAAFDAVVFIGYHAKAGTPDATIEHTSSGIVTDISINGVSLPEAGYNALMAGLHGVPVVFVAGDKAICDQARALFGEVETVAVKRGIGNAALCLHPEEACDRIRAGVEKAVRDRARFKPYRMKPPYTMVLKLKDEKVVNSGQFYPGTVRTGEWELTFKSDDLMEVIKAFSFTRR